MIIRPERPSDAAAIGTVTAQAFTDKWYSDGSEPAIIVRLRTAGVLAVSLVAEGEGAVIGHIGFSPVELSGGEKGWYALGPVAVRPDWQGTGIGGELVRRGIDALRERDAAGCVLVGAPKYYRRFGFAHPDGLSAIGERAEYFMALTLRAPQPLGIVTFHPAFYGDVA
ncbi:GNAT family N-acetyltransferase [Rhizobium halophytocola]|uniref:Acetyltransferase n=1 Tax=Rhizobium halophytocola TaxID=735519 RepID=A0ABS4DWL1_9HYPH|nr:N-acetyltransferase [Rhizobium halophytocola]MBP1850081.1 putative acetyltransferase [Rhizobium halophytocola]